MRQARKWVLFGCLIAIFVGLLLRTFLFETVRVASPAMEPALLVGDLVTISKLSYDFQLPSEHMGFLGFQAPEIGDVLLFGEGANLSFGRVRGKPGDRLVLIDNEVRSLEGDSSSFVASDGKEQTLTVPIGFYLILPDQRWRIDRLESFLVTEDEIIGRSKTVLFSIDWGDDGKTPQIRWQRTLLGVE